MRANKAHLRAILNRIVHWTCFMPKPVPLPPPGFDDLSVDEKIDYLQSLWDRIAATLRRFRFLTGTAKSSTSA